MVFLVIAKERKEECALYPRCFLCNLNTSYLVPDSSTKPSMIYIAFFFSNLLHGKWIISLWFLNLFIVNFSEMFWNIYIYIINGYVYICRRRWKESARVMTEYQKWAHRVYQQKQARRRSRIWSSPWEDHCD